MKKEKIKALIASLTWGGRKGETSLTRHLCWHSGCVNVRRMIQVCQSALIFIAS